MTLIEELVKIILPDFLKYLDVLEEEKNGFEKDIKKSPRVRRTMIVSLTSNFNGRGDKI